MVTPAAAAAELEAWQPPDEAQRALKYALLAFLDARPDGRLRPLLRPRPPHRLGARPRRRRRARPADAASPRGPLDPARRPLRARGRHAARRGAARGHRGVGDRGPGDRGGAAARRRPPVTCSLGVPTRHLDVRYLVRAPAGRGAGDQRRSRTTCAGGRWRRCRRTRTRCRRWSHRRRVPARIDAARRVRAHRQNSSCAYPAFARRAFAADQAEQHVADAEQHRGRPGHARAAPRAAPAAPTARPSPRGAARRRTGRAPAPRTRPARAPAGCSARRPAPGSGRGTTARRRARPPSARRPTASTSASPRTRFTAGPANDTRLRAARDRIAPWFTSTAPPGSGIPPSSRNSTGSTKVSAAFV